MQFATNPNARLGRPTGRLWLLAALVLLALSPARPAAAQEPTPPGPKPKVFLMPALGTEEGTPGLVVERVGDTVRDKLRSDARLELLPSWREMMRQSAGGSGAAAVTEAERLYAVGIGLLSAGEHARAAESFQRAVELMEQNLSEVQRFEVLVDALANLAVAYFKAGYDFDGRKTMQAYAHLRPGQKLPAEKFGKALLEVYREESAKVSKGGNGRLEIASPLAGAQVLVDGVPRGETPLTVKDVGFGYHYITVRHPSGGVWAQKVQVRGRDQLQKIEVAFGQNATAQAGAVTDADVPAYYAALRDAVRSGRFKAEDLAPYTREMASRTGAQYMAWVLLVRDGGRFRAHPLVHRLSDGVFWSGESYSFAPDLTNVQVGAAQLAKGLAGATQEIPATMALAKIDIVGATPKVETKPAAATDSVATAKTEALTSPTEPAAPQAPLPMPGVADASPSPRGIMPPAAAIETESGSRAWRYVGWTGAVLLVGGAVAGGIYFLSESESPAGPAGFEAEVSW